MLQDREKILAAGFNSFQEKPISGLHHVSRVLHPYQPDVHAVTILPASTPRLEPTAGW